jgi:hypothetical protein
MNNKISNLHHFFCRSSIKKSPVKHKSFMLLACGFVLGNILGIAQMAQAQAQAPAGGRILTGAFVDRDWSDANPCGDKVTQDWEWNDNKQWYGNVYPYFGKIFPEVFRPDGSKNWYANWQPEIARIKAQGRVPYINLEFHGELQRHNNAECWHLGGTGGNPLRPVC